MWPEFETQEEIPEGFRDQYEENDAGKWVAKNDELTEIKGALETQRKNAADAVKIAKAADKTAAEARTAQQEAEQALAAKKVGMSDDELTEFRTKMRADLTEEFQSDIDEKDAKIKEQDGFAVENRGLKLDAVVKKLMVDAGVRSKRAGDLYTLKRKSFDLTEDGKPKLVDHPGKTVDQFIDSLKKEYPEFWEGTKGDGDGTGGIQSDGKYQSGGSFEDMLKNPTAVLAAARAAGATQ